MMKLYHGSSNKDLECFEFDFNSSDAFDFGKGVYFTTNFDKAVHRACDNSKNEGAVYEIEIDDNLSTLDLNHKELSKTEDDLYYLFYICRIGLAELAPDFIDDFEKYDVISGPVLRGKKKASMDRYKDMAEHFNEGDITFEQLRENTRLSSEGFDQWCFKSKRAFDYINTRFFKKYIVEKRYDVLEEFEFKPRKGGDE